MPRPPHGVAGISLTAAAPAHRLLVAEATEVLASRRRRGEGRGTVWSLRQWFLLLLQLGTWGSRPPGGCSGATGAAGAGQGCGPLPQTRQRVVPLLLGAPYET